MLGRTYVILFFFPCSLRVLPFAVCFLVLLFMASSRRYPKLIPSFPPPQIKPGTRIDLPLWLGEMLAVGFVLYCTHPSPNYHLKQRKHLPNALNFPQFLQAHTRTAPAPTPPPSSPSTCLAPSLKRS